MWKFYLGLPRSNDFTMADKVKCLCRRRYSRAASATSAANCLNKDSNKNKGGRGELWLSSSSKSITCFPRKFYHGWIWGDTWSSDHKVNLNCLWWTPLPQNPYAPYFIFNLNCRILKTFPGRSRHPDICTHGLTQGGSWPQLRWRSFQRSASHREAFQKPHCLALAQTYRVGTIRNGAQQSVYLWRSLGDMIIGIIWQNLAQKPWS